MSMKFFGAEMEGVTLLENRTADPASFVGSRDTGRLFYNTTDQAVKFGAGGIFKTLDIPTGTVMVFGQSSAPAGWTKKTDWQDNSMMIITNGAIGGGGSVNATTPTAQSESAHVHTVNGHTHTIPSETLTIAQIPAHTHTISPSAYSSAAGISGFLGGAQVSTVSVTGSTGGGGSHNHGGTTGSNTSGTGAGSSHTHTITTPYYRTFIVATKD